MELEIGSPHKSLQSVDSLVWPRTVPRLRSLSTEQSQAKHIFIDCACVCLLEKEVSMCVCAYLGRQSMYKYGLVRMHKTKVLCILQSVLGVVKCRTFCHFLITNCSEINGIFAEPKSLSTHQTDLCVVMMSVES